MNTNFPSTNLASGVTTNQVNKTSTSGKDAHYCVRANLEAAVGLGLEFWTRKHTVRIAPSVMFEGTSWYSANTLFNLSETNIPNASNVSPSNATPYSPFATKPPVLHEMHTDDLILMGFSFNLQMDF